MKLEVRRSFARVYAALKARELQTLRQIEAVGRRLAPGHARLPPIDISFVNENAIFDEIRKFGAVDFQKLSLDGDAFVMEDYISPDDDHMYSYKCLNDSKDSDSSFEAAIEEDAIKQITNVDRCVCYVKVSPEEIPKKFREPASVSSDSICSPDVSEGKRSDEDSGSFTIVNDEDDASSASDDKSKTDAEKPNPTQDWLNKIINETETEPSQIIDLMEHSAIECS